MSNDKTSAYAAAELGTALRGSETSEFVRAFAGLIDDPKTIRWLNHYDSVIDEPIEETRQGKLVISNAATEMVDDAVRHGSVSQMKNATGLTSNQEDGGDLLTAAAEQLSYEGSIGLVFGSPGSGKTATTIDIALTWKARTGGSLIGNTPWEGFDRVVRSDREMMEAMANIEGPVLAVIDEIAQELSGFGEGNKAAEQFSDSLLFIRKSEEEHGPRPKKGSVLLVGHTRTKTAKSIRRVASFAVEKPTRSKPDRARLLESDGGKDKWEEVMTYQGLTDTAATYSEYDPSSFDVVMADDDDEDDGPSADDARREEHIRTAIKSVENGMGYGEVGYQNPEEKEEGDYLVPFSREWVGKRYREWRDDNRHTTLVPKND